MHRRLPEKHKETLRFEKRPLSQFVYNWHKIIRQHKGPSQERANHGPATNWSAWAPWRSQSTWASTRNLDIPHFVPPLLTSKFHQYDFDILLLFYQMEIPLQQYSA